MVMGFLLHLARSKPVFKLQRTQDGSDTTPGARGRSSAASPTEVVRKNDVPNSMYHGWYWPREMVDLSNIWFVPWLIWLIFDSMSKEVQEPGFSKDIKRSFHMVALGIMDTLNLVHLAATWKLKDTTMTCFPWISIEIEQQTQKLQAPLVAESNFQPCTKMKVWRSLGSAHWVLCVTPHAVAIRIKLQSTTLVLLTVSRILLGIHSLKYTYTQQWFDIDDIGGVTWGLGCIVSRQQLI